MKSKSLILVSGGMDSLLITALAHERSDELYALFYDYGQKTSRKERSAFDKICDFYDIAFENRKVLDLKELKTIGGSSLTDEGIDVSVELDKDEIPKSYVPFRNTIFLSFAASVAEAMGVDNIIIGAVLEDAPGYPDCRPEYYESFNKLLRVAAKDQSLQVETPIIHLKKSEILRKCLELKAPLELSWSCYQSEEKPCMSCDSCLLRTKAFREINQEDPLIK